MCLICAGALLTGCGNGGKKEAETSERKEKAIASLIERNAETDKPYGEQLKDKDLDEETRAELEKELKDGVDEKLADTDKINAAYLRRAIKKVNPSITDDDIDKYKDVQTLINEGEN